MNTIAIIGCGPAGLSTAIALHDAGLKVHLFEQFSQPGPVGSGLMLQPTGLEVLQRLGLREQAEHLGQRIDGMLGRVAPNGKVVLSIQYQELNSKRYTDPYGIAIHRASLFHLLYEAVLKRGIPITNTTTIDAINIVDTQSDNASVQLINTAGEALEGTYSFVTDASGTQSKLATRYGDRATPKAMPYGALWTTVKLDEEHFDRTLLEQRYDAASVMVGVLPCVGMITSRNLRPMAWMFGNNS